MRAAELVGYFKANARRVYARLNGERPEDLLAEALKEFLEDQGGSWDGQTSKLYELLKTHLAAERIMCAATVQQPE